VRNTDLHRDLAVEPVPAIITQRALSHEKRLQQHANPEAANLLNTEHLTRRLKRTKPFELPQHLLPG
jgi:hypothetical protein